MSHSESSDDDEGETRLRELPYLFEKELIEKQNKRRITVLDKYIPTVRGIIHTVPPMASKFYARHDQDPIIDEVSFQKYFQAAEGFLRRAQDDYKFPPLESQRLGWIPRRLDNKTVYGLNTQRMSKYKCDLTVFDEKVVCEKVTQRPTFNGVPFLLR